MENFEQGGATHVGDTSRATACRNAGTGSSNFGHHVHNNVYVGNPLDIPVEVLY
jgi:hypothetical protein